MADLKAFAEQLVNLSVKEVNELAEILKDEYGIEPAAAAAPIMVAGPGGGDGDGVAEEKSSFDLWLNSPGGAKLAIVKLVKDTKMKVQTAIQVDKLRVTGKKRDDLQRAMGVVKDANLGIPLQFNNFRD